MTEDHEQLTAVLDQIDEGVAVEHGEEGGARVEHDLLEPAHRAQGAAVLVGVAEVAGKDWTPELAEAWSEAYGAIASLMQQGAAKAA